MKTFEDYALLDLKQDKYYSLLNNYEVNTYIKQAILDGKSKAIYYKDKDLVVELNKNDIELIYSDENSSYDNLTIYGRTIVTNNKITIELFNRAIKEKQNKLISNGIDISFEELLRLHLAHEFYHALEYKENHDNYFVYQKILCFKVKRKLKALNEIAANSFAYYYLDEKIIPQSTDSY